MGMIDHVPMISHKTKSHIQIKEEINLLCLSIAHLFRSITPRELFHRIEILSHHHHIHKHIYEMSIFISRILRQ